MIEKQFTPTVSLFYKATREIFHSSRTAIIFYGFFVGLPVILFVTILIIEQITSKSIDTGIPTWGILIFCVLYAFGFMPALQYWNIKKALNSNPSANQTQNYTISEKGIRNYGLGVDVTLSWDKIIKTHKSKNYLLFYISSNSAYFIPLSLLGSTEIEQIYGWAESAA